MQCPRFRLGLHASSTSTLDIIGREALPLLPAICPISLGLTPQTNLVIVIGCSDFLLLLLSPMYPTVTTLKARFLCELIVCHHFNTYPSFCRRDPEHNPYPFMDSAGETGTPSKHWPSHSLLCLNNCLPPENHVPAAIIIEIGWYLG